MRPDGRPHVVPVWYEYDGREFTINCFRDTQKMKNIARKGFAALSIFSGAIPYRQVTVEGKREWAGRWTTSGGARGDAPSW